MEIRAQLAKPSASKSSVLQSIYGETIAFFFKYDVKLIAGSFRIMYMTSFYCSLMKLPHRKRMQYHGFHVGNTYMIYY